MNFLSRLIGREKRITSSDPLLGEFLGQRSGSTAFVDPNRASGLSVAQASISVISQNLNTVTPADVYFGRDKAILREGEIIKKQTIRHRRLQHQKQAA